MQLNLVRKIVSILGEDPLLLTFGLQLNLNKKIVLVLGEDLFLALDPGIALSPLQISGYALGDAHRESERSMMSELLI